MTTETAGAQQEPQALMRMMTGFWISQALYVAAKLGIADHLATRPQTVEFLAAALKADQGGNGCLKLNAASVGPWAPR